MESFASMGSTIVLCGLILNIELLASSFEVVSSDDVRLRSIGDACCCGTPRFGEARISVASDSSDSGATNILLSITGAPADADDRLRSCFFLAGKLWQQYKIEGIIWYRMPIYTKTEWKKLKPEEHEVFKRGWALEAAKIAMNDDGSLAFPKLAPWRTRPEKKRRA
ncbi:hypothetical protein R1sor_010028 [Riccia sorocarpa]|uniref:Uncharacterized protein n=1 Tax=Riccia sorocarpa TaxID=122646 RepID=A0ABD3I0G0_9MARC